MTAAQCPGAPVSCRDRDGPETGAPDPGSSLAHRQDTGPQQHPCPSCTGGQGTVPQEQNTQQVPGFGLSTVPQSLHS